MNIAKFLRTAFLYNISDGCFCVSKVCVTKTYHLTVKEFSVTLDFILPVGNRTNEREIIVLLSLKSEIFRHFNDFISVKYLVFMYLIFKYQPGFSIENLSFRFTHLLYPKFQSYECKGRRL